MGTKAEPLIENKEAVIRSFLNDIYTDPTLLSFDLILHPTLMFNTDDSVEAGPRPTFDIDSMLNAFEDNTKNVIATPHIYLKNLGETTRDKLWKRFALGLPNLLKQQQWRIQSIEGVDSILTGILNIKDGYQGSGDEKVTITCIEDINLTMFNLFDIYRECVYDTRYKRQLIPNNLLKFDCTIAIKDRRAIKWDSKASNSSLENLSPSSVSAEKGKSSGIMGALESVRGGISQANNFLDSLKTPKHVLEEHHTDLTDRAFSKPVICLRLYNCIFDLTPINKTFENINPGETDNNWAKFTFSIRYGRARMESLEVASLQTQDEIDELELTQPGSGLANVTGDTTGRGGSMESLISGGWDGALNSVKKYGQDYLDKAVEDAKSTMNNFANSVLGQEAGYDLSDNIYGQSNFISAFGKSVGDKLTELADEGIEKLKGATVGKAKEFMNTQKAKVQGAINNATSAIMGDGPTKSSNTKGNKLENIGYKEDSNPHFDKLTGNEKIDTGISTKNSDTFEAFNIYENMPSGPKQ